MSPSSLVNLSLKTRGFKFLWFDNRYTYYYGDDNKNISYSTLHKHFNNLSATGLHVRCTPFPICTIEYIPPYGIITDIDDEFVYIEYNLQSYNVKRELFKKHYTLKLDETSY